MIRRVLRDVRGATLVEFAFAAPIALLLMFAIVDFGRAIYDQSLVDNGARLGSRYAMVRGYQCTASDCPATQSAVAAYVDGQSPGVSASQLNVTVAYATPASSSYQAPPPANCATTPGQGCLVTVNVSTPFAFIALRSLFTSPTITLSSSSTMTMSQ
ncbi:MAG: TadE/TadG family type IV pilus assembly protein [Vulcanimicrobiaceae bacterium]